MTSDMTDTWWGPVERPDHRWASIRLSGLVIDAERRADGLDLVEIEDFVVEIQADISPPLRRPPTPADGSPWENEPRVSELLDSLTLTASATARDFLSWLRLQLRQYWIAPAGMPRPTQCLLSDQDSDETMAERSGTPSRPTPFMLLNTSPGSGSALREEELRPALSVILGAETECDSAVSELLLSSAFGKMWSAYPDPQTAVLLAVIACEIKIKTVLNLRLDSGGNSFSYLDQRRMRTFDRSLREEDEALMTRADEMRKARNHVAHRGTDLTQSEARDHLATASAVFAWLDSLPGGG